MCGVVGLCTMCPSSDKGDGAKPTGGTAELGSCCCYIHVCNIALPISLQSLQANREYREQVKINNKQGGLYGGYLQLWRGKSSDGNHGLKDSAEPRGEETKVYGFVETKHFITTTTDWSPHLDWWQRLGKRTHHRKEKHWIQLRMELSRKAEIKKS